MWKTFDGFFLQSVPHAFGWSVRFSLHHVFGANHICSKRLVCLSIRTHSDNMIFLILWWNFAWFLAIGAQYKLIVRETQANKKTLPTNSSSNWIRVTNEMHPSLIFFCPFCGRANYYSLAGSHLKCVRFCDGLDKRWIDGMNKKWIHHTHYNGLYIRLRPAAVFRTCAHSAHAPLRQYFNDMIETIYARDLACSATIPMHSALVEKLISPVLRTFVSLHVQTQSFFFLLLKLNFWCYCWCYLCLFVVVVAIIV